MTGFYDRKMTGFYDRKTEKPLVGSVLEKKERILEDFEYLLHHVAVMDDGTEELHHCMVYDHIANMFEQAHLTIRDGKAYLDGKLIKKDMTFHVIKGLEPKQEVVWSDEDAKKNEITPKRMFVGMTLKQKVKEW